MSETQKPGQTSKPSPEPEWEGPLWKHPYMIYLWLTAILFIVMVGIGYFAWTNGLIPDRGVSGG